MSTSKRRKLDTTEQPTALSAIARLRQTRSQASASASSSEGQDGDATAGDAALQTPDRDGQQTASTPRRGRKPKTQKAPAARDEARPSDAKDSGSRVVPTDPPSAEASEDVEGGPGPISQAPIIQFSNFRPTKSNFKKKADGKVQLKLSEGDRLVILGSYGIRVSSGIVTIYGATLRPVAKTYWVHAPLCYALPVLRCPEDAVVEIETHPAAESLRKLGSLSPLFRRLWNEPQQPQEPQSRKDVPSTFAILFTSADGPKKVTLADLKSPPEWNREMERLVVASRSKPAIVMVTGPKSSGKSTFGKLLANQLLTDKLGKKTASSIAVLDLDPGQPEYGAPGQISLVHVTEPILGPSFCSPHSSVSMHAGNQVIRSHTLASVTPASDPQLYLEAVADLLTHYRNRYASLPLVVNTPGWVQGTGLDMLTSLIDTMRPSHVLYMAFGPQDVIESLQASFRSGKVVCLPSQTTQLTARTAAHLRTMQTISYFHTAAKSGIPGWSTEPLSTVVPWELQYTGPDAGLLGVLCYDYQAPADLLADAINGTVLALVEVDNASAFRDLAHGEEDETHHPGSEMEVDSAEVRSSVVERLVVATPEGIPFIRTGTTLNPRYSQAIGLVLVRGIDSERQVLQVLTPIPEERIEQINERGGQVVLVSGRFDPPSWAYTEDLYGQSSTAAGGELGGEQGDEEMDIVDGDDAVGGPEVEPAGAGASTPWIEVLRGNQKRGVGSRIWRVRRDLGRAANTGD